MIIISRNALQIEKNTSVPQSQEIIKDLKYLFQSLINRQDPLFCSLKAYCLRQDSPFGFHHIINYAGKTFLNWQANVFLEEINSIHNFYTLSIESCKTEIIQNILNVHNEEYKIFKKEVRLLNKAITKSATSIRNLQTGLPFLLDFDESLKCFNVEVLEKISELKCLMFLAQESKLNWLEQLPSEALVVVFNSLPFKSVMNLECASKTLNYSAARLYYNNDLSNKLCQDLDLILDKLNSISAENPTKEKDFLSEMKKINLVVRKIKFLEQNSIKY